MQSIADLSVFTFAGAKVVIRKAAVRRGLILLTPSNTLVIGGAVPALVQQQQAVFAQLRQVQSKIAQFQDGDSDGGAAGQDSSGGQRQGSSEPTAAAAHRPYTSTGASYERSNGASQA